MATYTTDLTLFKDFETTTTVGEMLNYTAPGTPVANDADFPIQSVTHASGRMTKTGLGSIVADYGSNVSWTSGNYFFVWGVFLPAGAVDTLVNGGLRTIVGSDITTNYKAFYVGGNDFGRYPYGGWMNFVFNPEGTADDSAGSVPNTAYRWVGLGIKCISPISKGSPIGLDVIRYGRGDLRVVGTDATFTGMASANDASAARWGLFQEQAGSYLWKGLITLGYGGSTTFSDSNKSIVIDDTRKVSSTFNKIEIRNTSSSITWANISFVALGTVSRGSVECVDNATVSMTSCIFTNMDAFTFQAATSALDCTFRRTNAVTAPGSNLSGSIFETPTVAADASAVIWNTTTNTDGYLDNTTFSMGANAHHAIQLGATGAIPGTDGNITLRGITFTDFSTSDQVDGSVILLADTGEDVAWVINVVSCSGIVSIKKTRTGDSYTVVVNPRTVTVTTKDIDGNAVGSANVFLKAASGGSGILPVSATVNTITRVSTTATATHAAAHNMLSGDKVFIQGANQEEYNGVFTIIRTGDTTYTYTIVDPGTDATGTLTATFVFLKGTTHATTGILSMSRVITADQNVTGWARKHSTPPSYTPPNYKTSNITGTVLSSQNFDTTVLLISDD
ncbi:hypothetical protein KJ925_02960 [Patescibacteria group bacterium]|nr:hypothetical protein [Patescibacteria group bacterium]